ncbi:hypothetical protein KFE25_001693 [Diacronema lutheri]|uniref:RING-type domain-containing protein n=1 Tax=Diacronema lutheri TaxID=2081491 RepID=A0A8J6CAS4_DIALT|nr:hypothetical protein KFE25_001693 [Diacronema lutheri]
MLREANNAAAGGRGDGVEGGPAPAAALGGLRGLHCRAAAAIATAAKARGARGVWALVRSHVALAGPSLVPASVGVYAVFFLLLLRAEYGAACSLLGLAIYGACAFSCLHAHVPDSAALGAVSRPSLLDPLTALARSRAGVFALINIVALTSFLYISFMQHALHRHADGASAGANRGGALGGGALGGGALGGGGGARLVPQLEPAETMFSSRGGLVLLVNLGYSLLYSCFKALHAHVFESRLGATERSAVCERAASFVAAKVVLLAVLDPDMLEAVMWLSWFSLMGFLRVLARLVGLRLTGCASRPDGRRRASRLGGLAHVLVGSALFWLGVALVFCLTAGASARTLALLGSECALLALDALACVGHHRALCVRDWEAAHELRYRVTLAHDTIGALCAIAQHAHTWLINGLAGTMLDVFLIASAYAEACALARRLREHLAYVARAAELRRCPVATAEDLSSFDDHCAVCLDALLPAGAADADARHGCASPPCCARRLGCGHIFHSVCLSAWLEQHHTCPTCRAPTSTPHGAAARQQLRQPDIRLRRPPTDPDALDAAAPPPDAAELGASFARCADRVARRSAGCAPRAPGSHVG